MIKLKNFKMILFSNKIAKIAIIKNKETLTPVKKNHKEKKCLYNHKIYKKLKIELIKLSVNHRFCVKK